MWDIAVRLQPPPDRHGVASATTDETPNVRSANAKTVARGLYQ